MDGLQSQLQAIYETSRESKVICQNYVLKSLIKEKPILLQF